MIYWHLPTLGAAALLTLGAGGCAHPQPTAPPPVASVPNSMPPQSSMGQPQAGQTQRAATIQAMRSSARARGRMMKERAAH